MEPLGVAADGLSIGLATEMSSILTDMKSIFFIGVTGVPKERESAKVL